MIHGSNNKLVLIVDDTPTNVAVVSGVLKDSYRTKVATNGEKALASTGFALWRRGRNIHAAGIHVDLIGW